MSRLGSILVVLACLGVIVLALTMSFAHAHDRWGDGRAVPAWVRAQCCGPEDVHHLRPEQVTQGPDGYRIEGYPDPVPYDRALPSQDGDYWAFWAEYPRADGTRGFSRVFCFFVPMSG